MTRTPMHPDEAVVDVPLVTRLLAAQFPQWSGLPVSPVASAGTDNALFRLGTELVVRLPQIPAASGRLAAVIDFGGLGVGDPAVDLLVAWNLFEGPSRAAFRWPGPGGSSPNWPPTACSTRPEALSAVVRAPGWGSWTRPHRHSSS